jgi:hypothetical protein
LKLSDPTLLVGRCYVGCQWIGKGADPVENPATANPTPCGLATYFYARDLGRVPRVAEFTDIKYTLHAGLDR